MNNAKVVGELADDTDHKLQSDYEDNHARGSAIWYFGRKQNVAIYVSYNLLKH